MFPKVQALLSALESEAIEWQHVVKIGRTLNEKKIAEYLRNSLMLVTALSPVIGYDNASKIAHKAHLDGSTLRDAAIATSLIAPETFDKVVIPANMVGDTSVIFSESVNSTPP